MSNAYRSRPPNNVGELDVVVISKRDASAPMGLVLLPGNEDDFTFVMDMKGSGLVPEWNTQNPTQALQKGDQIVSVNGLGGKGHLGHMAIVAEMRKAGRMSVTVKRKAQSQVYDPPSHIGHLDTIVLSKKAAAAPVGLILVVENEEDFTSVMEVKASGLISEWNAQNPKQRLQTGDRILSVNGFGGLGERGYRAIISELGKVGELVLKVMPVERPPEEQVVRQQARENDIAEASGDLKVKPIKRQGGKQVGKTQSRADHVPKAVGDWVSKLPRLPTEKCTALLCMICMHHLNPDPEVIELPCGHCLHVYCAQKMTPFASLAEARCPKCQEVRTAPAKVSTCVSSPSAKVRTIASGAIKTEADEFILSSDLPDGGIEVMRPNSCNVELFVSSSPSLNRIGSDKLFPWQRSEQFLNSSEKYSSADRFGEWIEPVSTVSSQLIVKPWLASDDDIVEVELGVGAKYRGQWKMCQCHGQGRLTKQDGSWYDGSFEHGSAHGKGKFFAASGNFYEGEWEQDRAHGKGKYVFKDGGTYEGEWFHDNRHGMGVEKFADGSRYEGEFLHDVKHGFGTYTSNSGQVTFVGQFKRDKANGEGSYFFCDGRVYSGQLSLGRLHGHGVMTWPDGSKYHGAFKDDLREGEGTLSWPDGRMYRGQWVKGKQDGDGSVVDARGVEWKRKWSKGEKL